MIQSGQKYQTILESHCLLSVICSISMLTISCSLIYSIIGNTNSNICLNYCDGFQNNNNNNNNNRTNLICYNKAPAICECGRSDINDCSINSKGSFKITYIYGILIFTLLVAFIIFLSDKPNLDGSAFKDMIEFLSPVSLIDIFMRIICMILPILSIGILFILIERIERNGSSICMSAIYSNQDCCTFCHSQNYKECTSSSIEILNDDDNNEVCECSLWAPVFNVSEPITDETVTYASCVPVDYRGSSFGEEGITFGFFAFFFSIMSLLSLTFICTAGPIFSSPQTSALNSDNLTQLHVAVKNGSIIQIFSLLSRGASVEAQSPIDGSTPLHLAINLTGRTSPTTPGALTGIDSLDVLTTLLGPEAIVANNNQRINVNIRDYEQRTLLILAAQKGSSDAFNILLNESEIDVNAVDSSSSSAFHYLAQDVSKKRHLLIFLGVSSSDIVNEEEEEDDEEGRDLPTLHSTDWLAPNPTLKNELGRTPVDLVKLHYQLHPRIIALVEDYANKYT